MLVTGYLIFEPVHRHNATTGVQLWLLLARLGNQAFGKCADGLLVGLGCFAMPRPPKLVWRRTLPFQSPSDRTTATHQPAKQLIQLTRRLGTMLVPARWLHSDLHRRGRSFPRLRTGCAVGRGSSCCKAIASPKCAARPLRASMNDLLVQAAQRWRAGRAGRGRLLLTNRPLTGSAGDALAAAKGRKARDVLIQKLAIVLVGGRTSYHLPAAIAKCHRFRADLCHSAAIHFRAVVARSTR